MRGKLMMLAVVFALLCLPCSAWAAVEDHETALMSPEQLYQYEYVPDLNEVESVPVVRAVPDDATTVDWVNNTLDSFNGLQYASGNNKVLLVEGLRRFFGNSGNAGSLAQRNELILPAIGIVFMWWGVRKAIRVLFAALKNRRMSV